MTQILKKNIVRKIRFKKQNLILYLKEY
jgi:hypothetical protein